MAAPAQTKPPSSPSPPVPLFCCRLPTLPVRGPPHQSHKNVVSWTSSIARHARSGHLSDAISAFSAMSADGVSPNAVTLVTLLSACADLSASLPLALSLHAHVLKSFPNHALDVILCTALVDAYGKCGRADLARKVFDEMPVKNSVTHNTLIDAYMRRGEVDRARSVLRCMTIRDRVSWTAVINGCVANGLFDEALEHFREMQVDGINPDYVTAIAVLAVCAKLGALGHGLWMHRFAMGRDFQHNVRFNNSLIDAYSRCGRVDLARQVFDDMPRRTLVSWNSMIVGFAINGYSKEALEHFLMMQQVGFKPNGVSFTGALAACSHAGLVEEGLQHYDAMQKIHRISPAMEHYGCIVDLLARTGRLEDAMQVVERMPTRPNEVILSSLLAACRVHDNVGMAEKVAGWLGEMDPECDSNYVILSNMYAALGRWKGVGELRYAMKEKGLKKKPGFSKVEVGSSTHLFVAGDRTHPEADDIYDMLDILGFDMKFSGCNPEDNLLNQYTNW